MNEKPTIRDMEAILERHRREKGPDEKPHAEIPNAAPTTQAKPVPTKDGSRMELAPESSTQPVQGFLPDVPVEPEPPKAAPTAPREVSASKRKTPPSPLRMQYAYQWLCSFNMEFIIIGSCQVGKFGLYTY